MRKIKYTLNDILAIDNYIMTLASYEVSRGLMLSVENYDEYIQFQKNVKKQFNEFKRMIQCNECSIDELEQVVINRHGPVYNKYRNMDLIDSVNEYIMDNENSKNSKDDLFSINMDDFYEFLKYFNGMMDGIKKDDEGSIKINNDFSIPIKQDLPVKNNKKVTKTAKKKDIKDENKKNEN
jgi:hypothetical protein